MSERDELINEGRKLHAAWFDGPDMEQRDRMIRMAKVAREIHQPRTITTAEELDALAHGSVVLDASTATATKLDADYWEVAGFASHFRPEAVALPATVLYEPTA